MGWSTFIRKKTMAKDQVKNPNTLIDIKKKEVVNEKINNHDNFKLESS